MKILKLLKLLPVPLLVVVTGCAMECDDEMDDAISSFGAPDRVDRYRSGSSRSEYWWWNDPRRGRGFHYEKGGFSCDVTHSSSSSR